MFIECLRGITLFQEFSSLDNDACFWGNDELSRTIYKHIPTYTFCELLKAQLESLSNNDSDGYENVTETVNSHYSKLYHAYSISFNSSNFGKFCRS